MLVSFTLKNVSYMETNFSLSGTFDFFSLILCALRGATGGCISVCVCVCFKLFDFILERCWTFLATYYQH